MTEEEHIKVIKAALHVFEVVEGKSPEMRLESFERNPKTLCWEVGFSRLTEKGLLPSCEKRVNYLVTIDFSYSEENYRITSVGKVEQCE